MTGIPTRQALRLWPVPIVLAVQAIFFVLSTSPSISNGVRFLFMLLGPALGVLLFLGWLVFASRLTWTERLVYAASAVAGALLVSPFVHETIGLALFIYGVPLCSVAIPAALLLTQRRRQKPRVATVLAVIALVWSCFLLVRIDGFDGDYYPELSWRWSPTAEDALPAVAETPPQPAEDPWQPDAALWPGFRGPQGNSSASSGRDAPLDWTADPPEELWRIDIGPGWSSFSLVSGRLFTQEQRGDDEAVTCYDAGTGELIWIRTDAARFSDVVSGPGPRATPTYGDGRLFTLGAKGLLNCLDPADGSLNWQRDLMQELNAPLPVWGFSASPLVVDDIVIVYAGGEGDQGLVAYRTESGDPLWQFPSRGMNFSSAQLVTLDGVSTVLFGNSDGLVGLEPSTGKELWRYRPDAWEGPAICQPQQIGDDTLVVPLGDGVGCARLQVSLDSDGWNIAELWSGRSPRPSFNDFVHHDGFLYGFEQNIFVCVDAETGERMWKRGRYGFGQVVLIADTGQLVVSAEKDDVILLNCNPERHEELGRIQAVEGKMWNHPIVADGRLFVRNEREAVCYELR